eukprot:5404845-Pleurochrysis_carterae.AAC.1
MAPLPTAHSPSFNYRAVVSVPPMPALLWCAASRAARQHFLRGSFLAGRIRKHRTTFQAVLRRDALDSVARACIAAVGYVFRYLPPTPSRLGTKRELGTYCCTLVPGGIRR